MTLIITPVCESSNALGAVQACLATERNVINETDDETGLARAQAPSNEASEADITGEIMFVNSKPNFLTHE